MNHLAIDDSAQQQSAQLIALNKKLRWACHSIRLVALAWIVFDGGLTLWSWGDRRGALERLNKLYGLDPANVSGFGYWTSAAIVMLVWSIAAITVVRLWRLTGVYLEGRVFSVEAAATMRLVALTGFAAVTFSLVMRPLIVGLVSTELIAKVPTYFWFSPEDVLYLLFCGFVLALSVVFRTAAEIAREHAQFV